MSSGGASFEQHANKRRRPPAGPQRLTLSVQDADDAAAAVVPPVTVVLDGRCICHRVHLNRHTGYRSLAGTLRRMFVDSDDDDSDVHNHHHQQQQQSGAKVAPLPADHVLGAGGVYVLLPATRGKVSAEEARRALSAARSLARSRSMPGLRRKLSSSSSSNKGRGQPGAEEPAQAHREEDEDEAEAARPDGFEEHRPEFLSRELSSRGWKPSLRTIEERVLPKKTPHWLF